MRSIILLLSAYVGVGLAQYLIWDIVSSDLGLFVVLLIMQPSVF